jgi:radical SAM protein with 4Fe4S-binding SPASM domain
MSNTLDIKQWPHWDRLKAKRVPLQFSLEVTARCNNNCSHCYINLPENDHIAQRKELTVKEILNISEQAVKLGSVFCLLTGGEPLLRPDFFEIYLALKRKGLIITVFTNATLVNEQHVELFKKYPPRDLEVTVYGVTRETYEAVTRKHGSFEKFMHGLSLLGKGNIPIRLKTVAITSNIHEQAAIANFCRIHTKDYYRFDSQMNLRYDGDLVRNLEIQAERLSPKQIAALDNTQPKQMDMMKKICESFLDFNHNCNHLFHCNTGKFGFHVSYDGIFRLCSSLWAKGTIYDLRSGTLEDAWYNLVPQVFNLQSQRKEFKQSCHRCKLVDLCGWCPANAHLETGMLDGTTPYFCEVARTRAENLNITYAYK